MQCRETMLTRRLQVTHAGLSLSLMFAAIFGVYGVQLPYLPVWLNWRGFGPGSW